jgi:hypothetical protein
MPRGSYLTGMPRTSPLIVLAALTAVLAGSARAQTNNDILGDNYSIMKPEKGARPAQPEPWLAPKYKSPRGTVKHVVIPRSKSIEPPNTVVPPPIVVPQTGQVLPNLPTVQGSGPRGAETFQDRATRCAHQAGVYGQAAGDRNAYVGTCVNQ